MEGNGKEKTGETGIVIFGLTMQERLPVIPKPLADWLQARIKKYPADFRIDVRSNTGQESEIFERFEKIYSFNYGTGGRKGVSSVVFLYPEENWVVKIIGGLDSNDNIVGHTTNVAKGLPRDVRNEISGLTEENPAELRDIDEKSTGLLRKSPVVSIKEVEHTVVDPNFQWTSELTLTGAEVQVILNDPAKAEEYMTALYKKDWAKIGELAGKKIH